MKQDEPFIHPNALCESREVGARTRVWAFAHVLPQARIGAECNICDHVFIENDVVVGDRVTIKCGVQLWDGIRLEDDVFIGPNATFTNDIYPRSKAYPMTFPITVVEQGASIGANATILPGVRIGARAMIGAGAVVTRDVAPDSVMVGNPARAVRDSDEKTDQALVSEVKHWRGIEDCRQIELKSFTDDRGTLLPIEGARDIPFYSKRLFIITDVPTGVGRGAHANLLSDQFILPLSGGLSVRVHDGACEATYVLDRPDVGLLVPATVWNDLFNFLPGTVTVVLASDHYAGNQYIRDFATYETIRKGRE